MENRTCAGKGTAVPVQVLLEEGKGDRLCTKIGWIVSGGPRKVLYEPRNERLRVARPFFSDPRVHVPQQLLRKLVCRRHYR